MSIPFESWYSHKTDEYSIDIYIGRDCDFVALEEGRLEPGKIVETQIHYEKIHNCESERVFYNSNPLVAGEWLRDEIGHGPAKDAFIAMNIPSDSLLWKLGTKG